MTLTNVKLTMKRILTTSLLGLASVFANAQDKIDFVEYDLDNGMHVILHEDNSTPIVAVFGNVPRRIEK